MRIRPALYTALLCAMVLPAQAQERAAGGPIDTQMTWSALANKVQAADDKATGAHTRLDQLEACGKDGKFYAPNAPGAVKGCIAQTESSMEIVEHGAWKTGAGKMDLKCPRKLKFMNVMGNLTTNSSQAPCSLASFNCDHTRSDCIGKNECNLPAGWSTSKYYSAWGICI